MRNLGREAPLAGRRVDLGAGHLAIGLAIIAALALGACGRKGDPVLDEKTPDPLEQQYPVKTSPQSGIFGG